MRTRWLLFVVGMMICFSSRAGQLLIPMDDTQKNHLKSYGIAYWALEQGVEVKWLLNYRGGSFLMTGLKSIENECLIRGVSVEVISDAKANIILTEIARPDRNMDAIAMQKAPKIAVYSPSGKQPWDDAVTLVLTYAEIPYEVIYDTEILDGKLVDFDWLHLHHEDFTGQYGKFYKSYRHMPWYKEEVTQAEASAKRLGFFKVSEMKKVVVETIRNYVVRGGFLFAMCAATDTYDIALAAQDIDICESMFDGDPANPTANERLDFTRTFAFKDFTLVMDPFKYEFSDIDVTETRSVYQDLDYFSLFDFSAKWDPIPAMLCQNHRNMIKGFMGQTTAFDQNRLKPEVLVMGENKSAGEARYIHGEVGRGTWTFLGGHDPEDYRHLVGDLPTDLELFPNSPGYRLILNNVLFPAAKKKKQKT